MSGSLAESPALRALPVKTVIEYARRQYPVVETSANNIQIFWAILEPATTTKVCGMANA